MKSAKAILTLIGVFLFIYLIIGSINYYLYSMVERVEKDGYICIPTSSTLKQQSAILVDDGFIKDSSSYQTFAKMMKIDSVYPGRYELKKGMSYKILMNILNNGRQTPTKVIFNATSSVNTLAARVARQIEADSASIVNCIMNDSIQKRYGLDSISISTMFIPNTYEFYWNTSAEKFLERMYKEYNNFWAKSNRDSLLNSINMSKEQVMTLASIVYGETRYAPEMPIVAGVYMNRLKKRMPLQADPTIIFALNDPTIRRVLHKHLKIDSPYNTYKILGLPPGPINIPTISAIDAVLNYDKNDYLYFCASERLDGTHNFAVNYNTHLKNARLYSKKLNEMGIK